MNFKEIVNRIKELNISIEHFAYEGVSDPVLGTCEEVYQVGGRGAGDHWQSVHYFKDHDVYISVTGYYSSYNGTDFDDSEFEEVHPKEKTITVYE